MSNSIQDGMSMRFHFLDRQNIYTSGPGIHLVDKTRLLFVDTDYGEPFIQIDHEDGLHVVTIFHEVWKSLPEKAREVIDRHWLQFCDFNIYSPRITFGTMPDFDEAGVLAITHANGHRMLFNLEEVAALSDTAAATLVAVHLAYVYGVAETKCNEAFGVHSARFALTVAEGVAEDWGYSTSDSDVLPSVRQIRELLEGAALVS